MVIAVFRGPRYVVEWANPTVCTRWGRTYEQAVGTPLFELLPEAAGQGFEELLDGVLNMGIPHVAKELPSFIDCFLKEAVEIDPVEPLAVGVAPIGGGES